jgi:hypothetical protein
MSSEPTPKRQRQGPPPNALGYLVQHGAAGGGLFPVAWGACVNALQMATLKLAWATSRLPRLGAASSTLGLIYDLLERVGKMIQSRVLVVGGVKALRAAVADSSPSAAEVIELDTPWGQRGNATIGGRRRVFELGVLPLNIYRPVRLVSGAGGRATLVGGNPLSNVVEVFAEGVNLEGLAVGMVNEDASPGAISINRGGSVVLCGCDLVGCVTTCGNAELRGCVLHDCRTGEYGVGGDGVGANNEGATVLLVDTTVERCDGVGVYAVDGGVVTLEGNGNTVRECAGDGCDGVSLFGVRDGGRLEGVALESIGELDD